MYEIKNLTKSFGNNTVLKGIDLEIKNGTVTSILGPSGTGKSTLLRCLNLLEDPDCGSFNFNGRNINFENISKEETNFLRKNTAMVFQNFNLFKNLTVIRNIMEPLITVHNVDKNLAQERALELLKKVGLEEKKDKFPATLSGGQQQRVGIARALAVQADLILFDEPTSALDPELIVEVLEVIKNLANERESTLLIVTHEISFAKDVSDNIVFMENGKIVEQGSPEKIFNFPESERTKEFLKREMYVSGN